MVLSILNMTQECFNRACPGSPTPLSPPCRSLGFQDSLILLTRKGEGKCPLTTSLQLAASTPEIPTPAPPSMLWWGVVRLRLTGQTWSRAHKLKPVFTFLNGWVGGGGNAKEEYFVRSENYLKLKIFVHKKFY